MKKQIDIQNTDVMSIYQKSENILSDIQNIIETSQRRIVERLDVLLPLCEDLKEEYKDGAIGL